MHGAHNLTDCSNELVGELRTSINDYMQGLATVFPNHNYTPLCKLMCSRGVLAWTRVNHFGEFVNHNQYGSVTLLCLTQSDYAVCSDVVSCMHLQVWEVAAIC